MDEIDTEVLDERSCGRSQTSLYNPRRRHSTIGYLSPMEFEQTGAISLGWCLPNRQQLIDPREASNDFVDHAVGEVVLLGLNVALPNVNECFSSSVRE